MKAYITPEELVRHGETIERMLKEDAVQQVLEAVDALFYTRFKEARAPEERELIWAQASAFDALKLAFEQVVDAGQNAAHQIEREELAEAMRTAHQH